MMQMVSPGRCPGGNAITIVRLCYALGEGSCCFHVNAFEAIILGVIEGLTEFLPISSTGHLIITTRAMGLDATEVEREAFAAYNIMIQGGAILAVAGLFWSRIREMLAGITGRSSVGLRLFRNLIIAFLPAAVIGVLLNDWIKAKLFFTGPVAAALLVGGIVLIFLRRWQRSFFHDPNEPGTPPERTYTDIDYLSWRKALVIGLLQCIAMWPGTSRSMMTIIAGMLVGMRPKHAAEFSFLLGLPTLGGACVYEGLQMFVLAEPGAGPPPLEIEKVILGALMAFLAAALAVKWMVGYLSKHGLALFGWYRIALGSVILILLATGWLPERPALEGVPDRAPDAETIAHAVHGVSLDLSNTTSALIREPAAR